MINQILVILLVIGIVWFFFIKKKPKISSANKEQKSNYKSKKVSEDEKIMVECESCGVYISSDEAILSSGKYYCPDECLKGIRCWLFGS